MTDQFSAYRTTIESPAEHAALVSPSDTVNLANASRGIWVGTQGDVKVTMVGGETLVIPAVSGFMPWRVQRIWSTGTTASGIVAFW